MAASRTTFGGLKPVDLSEIEDVNKKKLSVWAQWANDAVQAFMEMDVEAVEVTEWPTGRDASSIASFIKGAGYRVNADGAYKVKTRGGRVFMVKVPKAGKVVEFESATAGKKRIPMPKSSSGLKKAVR